MMKYILSFCCILFLQSATQASEILNRKVDIQFTEEPVASAMQLVAEKAKFEWSYNARIIDTKKRVSFSAQNWTVRETLSEILGSSFHYKERGNYLILKKRKEKNIHLSGFISDKKTGKKVSNVVVYDRTTLRSTKTDANGYYELPVRKNTEIVVVSPLAKSDTTFKYINSTTAPIRLELDFDSIPVPDKEPFLQRELFNLRQGIFDFFVRERQKNITETVQDSFHRTWQISLLPMIGTNHRLSGKVVNDWSFNILTGYSKGSRKAELGGIGNISRGDVAGVQIGGIFNNVNGNTHGIQVGGIVNTCAKNVRGIQLGGLVNLAVDTMWGVQIAGLQNSVGTMPNGIQVGGLHNQSKLEAGFQVAGLVNTAKVVHKIQVAGIGNQAKTVTGLQIAGIFNSTDSLSGFQVGLINRANHIDGAQLGLINYSKTGGIADIEISYSEMLPFNVSYKSGWRYLYTHLTYGSDLSGNFNNRLQGWGAGLGSRFLQRKRISISGEVLARQLVQNSEYEQVWLQAGLNVHLNLGKRVSLFAGPTANYLWGEAESVNNTDIENRISSTWENRRGSEIEIGWNAWTGGIRFRL